MRDAVRKSKMISLRVSEVEYEAMRKLYRSVGARSVSDFARLAMQRTMARSDAEESTLWTKVREIDGRVSALEGRISGLMEKGATA